MPDWKEFEGHLLDGKYPLERYVGGDNDGAVFLLGYVSTAARIRRAEPTEASALVERWKRVSLIRHPHLLEIDAAGVASLNGDTVSYLVGEHAEQNLAEILAERPLTSEEAREMLTQVATALEHLHNRGLAHGDLKASNILALGDSVKVSSESVADGEPAADIRALGYLLVHALTQREETTGDGVRVAAAGLPAPFSEIANGCLHPDPDRRWTAARILARLRLPDQVKPAPPVPMAAPAAGPSIRRYALPIGVLAAGLAVAAVVVIRRPDASPPPVTQQPERPAVVTPAPKPAAPVNPAPEPEALAVARPPAKQESTRDRIAIEGGVTERVVPKVPPQARNTIDGRPVVVVRVTVGPTGNVTEAKVDRTFSSYFSKLALEAARKWRFVPDEGAAAREWTLRFQFTRTDTRVDARKTGGGR